MFVFTNVSAQNLENHQLKVEFEANGAIHQFTYGKNKTVEFRKDQKFKGPALFFADRELKSSFIKTENTASLVFTGHTDTLNYTLGYHLEKNALVATVKIKNNKSTIIEIPSLSLKLGVNTEMDTYPHWNDVFFPTLLRCESTHFWGYLMNPKGEILIISSPDAIASWHNDYKTNEHRILTTNLDLMHSLPLPERHPGNLHSLKAGEEKTWKIYFNLTDNLLQVKDIAAKNCDAPMIDAPLYTISAGENFDISLKGNVKSALIISPDTKKQNLSFTNNKINYYPTAGPGKYKLLIMGGNNKISESMFTVRQAWSWYLQKARLNALEQEQKATSNCESWYGLFSAFLAQKYFPDKELLGRTMDKFNELYPLLYDDNDYPTKYISRIQNTSSMASLLVDVYQVTSDTTYLSRASKMCDFLIKNQDITGAYKNGHTHYTSVIYIAKSIMEVFQAEKILAETSDIWKSRYQRHFASVTKAIDELVMHKDDIQTEGEMTYEDGMISCSYTQIAMYALLIPESQRQKYIEAAEYLRKGHRSLSQLLVPDSRMNGGSLRYWESQYDVLSFNNMMSSPHGWSAWRIYGLWYLYQLNGNPDLIAQIYNALGADVQLCDENTGLLRWGFCVDPYIKGTILVKDPNVISRENKGISKDTIVGEQYINMISNWHKAPIDTWVTGYWTPDGGCCDNDVHEIFKCLEEIAIANACVVQMPDGEIKAYNCKAIYKNNVLEIETSEHFVNTINVNNQNSKALKVLFRNRRETVAGRKMEIFKF